MITVGHWKLLDIINYNLRSLLFTHQSSERDREHTPWCIAAERTNESCEGGHPSGNIEALEIKNTII